MGCFLQGIQNKGQKTKNQLQVVRFPLTMIAISFKQFDTLGMFAKHRILFSFKSRFLVTPYS